MHGRPKAIAAYLVGSHQLQVSQVGMATELRVGEAIAYLSNTSNAHQVRLLSSRLAGESSFHNLSRCSPIT
jgi:hypothetical protein